jgi:hypothetical protein
LDWIKLDGSGSTVPSGPATYSWQLLSQPAGSTTALSAAAAAQTELQTLVSGSYVIALTVKDASGCSATAAVTIAVLSAAAVHLELTWNTSCGDLDLHYANYPATPTGSCDANSPNDGVDDCAYYNTTTTWGATLDHDALDGYGPENISQQTAAAGSYQAWVYYYGPNSSGVGSTVCGTVIPTVNVYLSGTLAGTYVLDGGMQIGEAWNAAEIDVAGAEPLPSPGPAAAIDGGTMPCTQN